MGSVGFSLLYATRDDLEAATRDVGIEISESGAIRLARSLILTDEMGRINSRTFERITDNIWARKEFIIDDPNVRSAELAVFSFCEQGGDGAPLYVEVNGYRVVHEWRAVRGYWEDRWAGIPVPVEYLKKGLNEFVFHADRGIVWDLWVENSLWPNRSAKSIDWGQTWNYDRMGFNDSCNGEYVVRLRLGRYPGKGTLTSPIIDLAWLAAGSVVARRTTLNDLTLTCQKDEPEGTSVSFQARIGRTPDYSPEAWLSWKTLDELLRDDSARGAAYRYFQWRVILSTTVANLTPEVRSVGVEADVKVEDTPDAGRTKVCEFKNERVVRGSYPFAFQPYEEERLKIMRERYELDWVIAKGTTDFEKLVLLRDWVRQQWTDGWKSAINWGGRLGYIDYCPPWDGLVILELARRKLSLGMCTHYSTVLVHACAALGYPARTVIIGAHCVTEVWSNVHRKWVMFDVGGDVNDSTMATFHFEKNGIPLSALEAHQAWLRKEAESVRIVPEKAAARFPDVNGKLSNFERFCITLRNDEMTSLEPGEPEHGAMCYHYDGYLWWKDETSPSPWFSLQSDRAGDFQWTLNQTEVHLGHSDVQGTLDVQLETVTPNFAGFLVRIDGGDWVKKPGSFPWPLHGGLNSLDAKSLNKFGWDGIISTVKLLYTP